MRDMPVCGHCRGPMSCIKNEVDVDCGESYVKSGDLYACGKCANSVIVGFGKMYRRRKEELQTA